MQEKNTTKTKTTQNPVQLTERDLDNRLLSLLHNTEDSYKAFVTAVTVISAFLEQPQSSD